MTSFSIQSYPFTPGIDQASSDPMLHNWPVVYVLSDAGAKPGTPGSIYFGETLNFSARMRQHLESSEKQALSTVQVVLDETFNKSVCLDLESQLIKLAAGDGTYAVLNRNDGVVDANYYDRAHYRQVFDEVFYKLRELGIFERTIPQIINSQLFKLSPFKALNTDQAAAVEDILEGLSYDLQDQERPRSILVVQGDPGTGKTIVAIYLMKLMVDIATQRDEEDIDRDTMFSEFFLPGHREAFQDLHVGLVIPQQSLRDSIRKVFAQTPGLSKSMVMSMMEVADDPREFDVLIVDEAHRLSQFGAQAHGTLTKRYKDVNERLFGGARPMASQLEWLKKKAKHVVLLLDSGQSVRPGDIPKAEFDALLSEISKEGRKPYRLYTQMRSEGGNRYIDYVQAILSPHPPTPQPDFLPYEVGIIDDPAELVRRVRQKDAEIGLSRVIAGYAWPWRSRKDPSAIDIDLGEGARMKWNVKDVDWVNSPGSLYEAGSIHTIQGYDLNYAGVIIGEDLQFDPRTEQLVVDRASYFDARGKSNNKMAGQVTTDEMLLEYITNIYSVLMSRGIKGTYIHVVNPALRDYFKRFFPTIG